MTSINILIPLTGHTDYFIKQRLTRFLHPESDSYSQPGDKSEDGVASVLISEESYLEDCILPQAGINEAT